MGSGARKAASLFALALALTGGHVRAASMEVAPTTVELAGPRRAAVLYVTNHSDEPLSFQVEVLEWGQGPGGDTLRPTRVVQASPAIAELKPGERQIVRVRAFGPPSASEQAYRLVVTELPAGPAGGAQQVRVLMQFRIPAFVTGPSGDQPRLTWTARRRGDGVLVTAANTGARRAKFTAVRLRQGSEAGGAVDKNLAYVLAGGRRSWLLKAPAGGTDSALKIDAYTEDGEILSFPVDGQE